MSRKVLGFVVLVASVGCGTEGGGASEEVTVQATKTPCFIGLGATMCLQLVHDDLTVEQASDIEGFTHRWGFEARISLRREAVDPGTTDGADEKLVLQSVLSETPNAQAPFTIRFPPAPIVWFYGQASPLSLALDTQVECDAPTCDALRAADTARTPFDATFDLTADAGTLRALSVAPVP